MTYLVCYFDIAIKADLRNYQGPTGEK